MMVASILGGTNFVRADLICDSHPQTVEEAKICMEGFLGKTAEIHDLLASENHIGDMSACQQTQEPIRSYFANNGIANVLKNVTLGDCEDAGDEYKCFVNLYQNACFITPNGTRSKTKTAIMRVEKASGKLIDFYPVSKR